MRALLALALLLSSSVHAVAQTAPRSLALDVGIARDLGGASSTGVPVGLVATFWIVGDLDATVRATWRFAPRTDGRGVDGAFDAGAGLRWSLAPGPLRPQLLAGAGFVQVLGSPYQPPDLGFRVSAGAALEALFRRDLSASLVADAAEVLLASGAATASLGLALRVGVYF